MSILNYIDLEGQDTQLIAPGFPPTSKQHEEEGGVQELGELSPAAKRPRIAPPRIVAMLRLTDAYVSHLPAKSKKRKKKKKQWAPSVALLFHAPHPRPCSQFLSRTRGATLVPTWTEKAKKGEGNHRLGNPLKINVRTYLRNNGKNRKKISLISIPLNRQHHTSSLRTSFSRRQQSAFRRTGKSPTRQSR